MKKINKLLITTLTTVMFITSCSNPLLHDPRLYNQANKNEIQNNGSGNEDDSLNEEDFEIPEEKPQEPVDPNNIDPKDITNFDRTDYWFNTDNCNSDSNKTDNISFPASEFDQLSLHAKFVEGNIPVYSFTKKANPWEKESAVVYRDKSHGNTTAYGAGKNQNVTGVSILQYRGINPANNAPNYRESYTKIGFPLLKRFYFYRFQGSAPMGIVLDNYLIAIDTYSKFIFAFAKPDPSKLGLMDAPGAVAKGGWLPIDTAEKRFYMYDPVGYVQKTGENNYEVVLYDWFKQNLTAGKYEGVENYKDSVDDTKIAKKTPDGAGQSPFAAKLSEFNGPITIPTRSFSNSVKNNTYLLRDKNGNGLNKYEFGFNDTGKKVIVKKTPWGSDEITQTFDIQDSTEDCTKGIMKTNDKDITLKIDDALGLIINETIAVKAHDFIDLGPSFEYMVQNRPAFESNDKTHSYFFKEGMNSLVIDNKLTYGFDCFQPERNRAIYSRKEGISWYLIGIELCDDGKTIKKTEEKTKVFTSEVNWNTLGTSAVLVDKISGKSFATIVANQTFGFRELAGYSGTDGQGYGLNLYTYKFNSDGTKLTFTKTPWRKDSINIVYDVKPKQDNNTTATVTINNKDIELTINNTATILTIGENLAYLNFKDLGPSFENRVNDNPQFTSEKNNYQFSNGLKTLKMDGKDHVFIRIEPERNRAVYGRITTKLPLIGDVWWFWGIELSNNDSTIKSTNRSSKDAIQWNTLSYAATRQ